MGLNNLAESYDILLGFGIMIVVKFLKWLGQYPVSKHVFAIVIMFFKHVLSLIMLLRYPYDSLLGLDTDMLLYLTIVLVNSSSANNVYGDEKYNPSSFRTLSSM